MLDISDEERRRRVNSLRFAWHENVLRDAELRKHPTALAVAGYIMHRFKAQSGVAEFSIDGAARALDMPSRSVSRARKLLEERGWIRKLAGPHSQRLGWSANRYILTGGPDDLELEAHDANAQSDSRAIVGDASADDTCVSGGARDIAVGLGMTPATGGQCHACRTYYCRDL